MDLKGKFGGPAAIAVLLAGCPSAQVVAIPTTCTFDAGPEPLNPNHQLSYQVNPGARNPDNDCQVCVPSANPSDWTALDAGTPCGDAGGMFCDPAQRCIPTCFIEGVLFNPVADPEDGCQLCIPDVSGTGWTPRLCQPGTNSVCVGGSCEPGCLIDGGFVSAGTVNPASSCLGCEPDSGTTSWSWLPVGTPCDGTSYCFGGNCVAGCFIGGTIYLPGQADSLNVCWACEPDAGPTTGWTMVSSGSPCKDGGVCEDGGCCSPVNGPCSSAAECCNSQLECRQGTCQCVMHNGVGDLCKQDHDCCDPGSYFCDLPTGACTCFRSGFACTMPNHCCSGACIDGGCACSAPGASCAYDSDCCNGHCGSDAGCS